MELSQKQKNVLKRRLTEIEEMVKVSDEKWDNAFGVSRDEAILNSIKCLKGYIELEL